MQGIDDRSTDDNRGTVLVIVKHRDFHAFTQLAFDLEAFRRLDVFQIDAAESRLHAGDDVDQFVRIVFIDFDVEYVNAGKLLEQNALAFHHRLAGQGADIAQAEYRGAVGDHGHQVGAGGQRRRLPRIGNDGLAGMRHPWRVGQGQIALGHHRLGGADLDLAVRRHPVVIECRLLEIFFRHFRFQNRAPLVLTLYCTQCRSKPA